jgi:hypothetical protein
MTIDGLDGIRTLIGAAMTQAETLVGGYAKPGWGAAGFTTANGSPLVMATRVAVKSVAADFSAANGLLEDLSVALPQLWAEQQYTTDARADLASEALNSARGQINELVDRVAATVATLRDRLAAAALPPRPTPIDSAQEARLASLKSDLRMLFDPRSPEVLPTVMLDQLSRLVESGDALGLWLLAGDSGWPQLYLRSRASEDSIDGLLVVYERGVADQLRSGIDDGESDADFARRMLEVIDGKRGLKAALTAMQVLVRLRLDQLAVLR